MENVFNAKRFLNLVKAFFIENGFRMLLYFLLTSAGLTVVLSLIYGFGDLHSYVNARFLFLFLFLVVNQSIVMNVTGQDFKSKSKISHYLLLPNSALEKTLLYIICFQFFYLLVSLSLFKLIDYSIVKEFIPSIQLTSNKFVLQALPMDYNMDVLECVLLVLVFFNLLSFTFFLTNRLLKAIFGFVFVGFMFGLSIILNTMFFYDVDLKGGGILPFGPVFVKNALEGGIAYVLMSNKSDLYHITVVMLPLILLGLGVYYFKLKEKEV